MHETLNFASKEFANARVATHFLSWFVLYFLQLGVAGGLTKPPRLHKVIFFRGPPLTRFRHLHEFRALTLPARLERLFFSGFAVQVSFAWVFPGCDPKSFPILPSSSGQSFTAFPACRKRGVCVMTPSPLLLAPFSLFQQASINLRVLAHPLSGLPVSPQTIFLSGVFG